MFECPIYYNKKRKYVIISIGDIMNKKLKFLIYICVLSIFMLAFFLFWGERADLMGFINSTFATGIILFGLAWLIYASNFGLFDIAVYGTKKLWLVIFGKQAENCNQYLSKGSKVYVEGKITVEVKDLETVVGSN